MIPASSGGLRERWEEGRGEQFAHDAGRFPGLHSAQRAVGRSRQPKPGQQSRIPLPVNGGSGVQDHLGQGLSPELHALSGLCSLSAAPGLLVPRLTCRLSTGYVSPKSRCPAGRGHVSRLGRRGVRAHVSTFCAGPWCSSWSPEQAPTKAPTLVAATWNPRDPRADGACASDRVGVYQVWGTTRDLSPSEEWSLAAVEVGLSGRPRGEALAPRASGPTRGPRRDSSRPSCR